MRRFLISFMFAISALAATLAVSADSWPSGH